MELSQTPDRRTAHARRTVMNRMDRLRVLAEAEILRTMDSLPPALDKASRIPVILEALPSPQDVEEGIDPDVLGLFVGAAWGQSSDQAAHILLFLENLWEEAEEDEAIFLKEVRITLLHELGHYLDLDEDDLEERGLG